MSILLDYAMTVDSIQRQLTSARSRFATLDRRARSHNAVSGPLEESMRELERALEELQGAQDRLVEQREELEVIRVELQREREKYWQLFDGAPEPYVVTGPELQIMDANRAASEMLNISQRFLNGKSLSIFVCKDRGVFMSNTARIVTTGGTGEWILRIRPRERAPLDIVARVVVNQASANASLHWIFRPSPAASAQ